MKRYFIHIIIIIVLSSCVKETEWEIPENGKEYIVVDGILTNEYKVQKLSSHYSKAGMNDIAIPVSGAEVIINTAYETYQLNEDPEKAGKMKDTVAKITPMGRLGQPEDVAGAVMFFASDDMINPC